jgi:hypothetical protein
MAVPGLDPGIVPAIPRRLRSNRPPTPSLVPAWPA